MYTDYVVAFSDCINLPAWTEFTCNQPNDHFIWSLSPALSVHKRLLCFFVDFWINACIHTCLLGFFMFHLWTIYIYTNRFSPTVKHGKHNNNMYALEWKLQIDNNGFGGFYSNDKAKYWYWWMIKYTHTNSNAYIPWSRNMLIRNILMHYY